MHFGGPEARGRDNYLTDVLSSLAGSFISQTAKKHPEKPRLP